MKIGGNYIDKEGKGGTVRYLPRSGLLEPATAQDGKQPPPVSSTVLAAAPPGIAVSTTSRLALILKNGSIVEESSNIH